jgi:SAM-dependent methyltransferase
VSDHTPTTPPGESAYPITYGPGGIDETDLRLLGEIAEGARVLELGISEWRNSIAIAAAGGRAIAVDPDTARIDDLRRRAEGADVRVQCLHAELADLGDVTSSSCRAVIAVGSLGAVDDLSRVLRQVHRVLMPGTPFVIAAAHPAATTSAERPYGAGDRTIADWLTALRRTNFGIEQLHELGVGRRGPLPTDLVIKGRKEGN